MELQTVKFVNIFRRVPAGTKRPDQKPGEFEVAIVPITSPQKIRAYIDSGDLQPENAKNNDHGWRLDPQITAQLRNILEDPSKLEQIAKDTSTPLDMLNAFRVFMYEVSRNRALARRAAINTLDKEEATSEYEQQVAKERQKLLDSESEEGEGDEEQPETASQRRRREASQGNQMWKYQLISMRVNGKLSS